MAWQTIESERLIFRKWTNDDVGEYAAICADPQVMQYMGGQTFNRMETWRHIAFMLGHHELRGYSHWAVEEKSSGKFIGRMGFLNPADYPGFEIGWTLARASWGQGFASEGARVLLDYAFDELGQEEVISLIHPENEASKNVSRKLGMKYKETVVVKGLEAEVFAITKSKWQVINTK